MAHNIRQNLLTKGHGKGLTRQRLWLFSRCDLGSRL
jgi:hypothetical protein